MGKRRRTRLCKRGRYCAILVSCWDLCCVINNHNCDVAFSAFDFKAQLIFESSLPRSEYVCTQLGAGIYVELVSALEACLVQDGDGRATGSHRRIGPAWRWHRELDCKKIGKLAHVSVEAKSRSCRCCASLLNGVNFRTIFAGC